MVFSSCFFFFFFLSEWNGKDHHALAASPRVYIQNRHVRKHTHKHTHSCPLTHTLIHTLTCTHRHTYSLAHTHLQPYSFTLVDETCFAGYSFSSSLAWAMAFSALAEPSKRCEAMAAWWDMLFLTMSPFLHNVISCTTKTQDKKFKQQFHTSVDSQTMCKKGKRILNT